jgi:hypothetical protein
MVLFVASLPVVRSRAPSSLSLGGRDHSAVAASSIPQGICSLHHGCSCLVVAPTVSRMMAVGEQEKGQKKIIVRRNARREVLF